MKTFGEIFKMCEGNLNLAVALAIKNDVQIDDKYNDFKSITWAYYEVVSHEVLRNLVMKKLGEIGSAKDWMKLIDSSKAKERGHAEILSYAYQSIMKCEGDFGVWVDLNKDSAGSERSVYRNFALQKMLEQGSFFDWYQFSPYFDTEKSIRKERIVALAESFEECRLVYDEFYEVIKSVDYYIINETKRAIPCSHVPSCKKFPKDKVSGIEVICKNLISKAVTCDQKIILRGIVYTTKILEKVKTEGYCNSRIIDLHRYKLFADVNIDDLDNEIIETGNCMAHANYVEKILENKKAAIEIMIRSLS